MVYSRGVGTQRPPVINWVGRSEFEKNALPSEMAYSRGCDNSVLEGLPHHEHAAEPRATVPADLEPPKGWGLGLAIKGRAGLGRRARLKIGHKQPIRRLLPCPSCVKADKISQGCHTDCKA